MVLMPWACPYSGSGAVLTSRFSLVAQGLAHAGQLLSPGYLVPTPSLHPPLWRAPTYFCSVRLRL